MDLVASVLEAGDVHGAAPALTGPRGRTLSHAGLARRIRAVAHGLRAAGFASDPAAGERLLFSVRPSPDAVVLALGAVAAGGTVVFVDPGVGPALFAARVELAAAGWAGAESVLYAAGRRPLRALARRRGVLLPDYARLPVRHVRVGRWLPGVPRGALPLSRWTGAAASRSSAGPGPSIDTTYSPIGTAAPDQDAVVVFTAGTTAAPRAVVHTRGSLGAALNVLATRCALGPGTRVHTDQFLLGLPALVGGGHWTMPPYGFAPGARPDQLARDLVGATHTFLVPADLDSVLDGVEAGEVALPVSLRQVLLGSAPVLPPLLRRARAALPDVEFLAVYGMTEILPVAVATAEEKLAHTGTGDLLGTPLPGVRVRIAGGSPATAGAAAGAGIESGELVVSGPNLARGYLGEPPMTEHATGDLVRLDGGRIVLVGRAKDMIIRGSVNIYPGLHEPLITRLPGVAAALLLGVPDAIGDERVVLVLEPTDGAAPGLTDRVRAALPGLIDAGARPDEIVLVDAVPLVGRTRKPDRAALRARLARTESPTRGW